MLGGNNVRIAFIMNEPTNQRKIKTESDRKFLYLTIFTLVVIGGGIIALVYGPASLITAVPCLLGGAAAILIPWWALTALERWRQRMEQRDRDLLDL